MCDSVITITSTKLDPTAFLLYVRFLSYCYLNISNLHFKKKIYSDADKVLIAFLYICSSIETKYHLTCYNLYTKIAVIQLNKVYNVKL